MAELYKTITEQSIDRHFPNDPSAKAAIMSQIQRENNTFDPHRIEKTDKKNKGIGLFQFTGPQRDSLERWLRDNGKANTIDNQIEYFKIVTTTTNQDWADRYHDIGAGHRNHIRNAFASGSAADISKELSNRFEKFKGYKTDVSRPNLATKLEPTYQQEYVNRLANQQQMQPTPQQAGYTGFAMEDFGTPQRPTPQQQYEAARMNRPPLTPPQMAVPDKSMMYPQPKRSLQQVAQTAQAQPALNPFPWLNEVSGSYSHPAVRPEMYPQKKMFKGASMYPRPKNF